MPKVWTEAQRGISRPGPAASRSSGRQAQQPGAETDRDRHLVAADDAGAASESRREAGIDLPKAPATADLSPLPTDPISLDFDRENPFSVQPGVQGGARQGTELG